MRNVSDNTGGRGALTSAPISLQDLRRRLYVKAKAEKDWQFWGLYVHVGKLETLRAAYDVAKENHGAPGIDGVTFAAIEDAGVERFLVELRDELVARTYRPLRNRRVEIPKDGGKVRVLSIPAIRDRVVQGALTLILEPIVAADFQEGSYGYRPKRSAHDAVERVAEAIVHSKTRVLAIALKAYFDNIRHHRLLAQGAQRVNAPDVLHVFKLILKHTGKKGVAQGDVLGPLLSNRSLTEGERLLERATQVTRRGQDTYIEYCRCAADLVIVVDAYPQHDWLLTAVTKRLREALAALQVTINEEKRRIVDLAKGESFGFLGFDFRRVRSLQGQWRAYYPPQLKKRTALLRKLKRIFRRYPSQPVDRVIQLINPILRGWVTYCALGDARRCFGYVRDWVEKTVRRHLMRARKCRGFGWKRWRRRWLYDRLGLCKHSR